MTLAVGRLVDAATGVKLGTVFAVTGRLALTAFHCVGNHESGKVRFPRVRCEWSEGISNAFVDDSDRHDDIALLRLDRELPPGLDLVRLARDVAEHARFAAPGSPAEVPDVSPFTVSGEVIWLSSAMGGTRVMQLACRESAAELSLRGMSGAPVLVGQPQRAVGMVRWNSPREERPELAAGGAVFATPAAAVLDRWPQLGPAHAADDADLRRLLRRLAPRSRGRGAAGIRADIWQLLLAGGLGLDDDDLVADLEALAEGHCHIAVRPARILIEISRDLREDGAVAGAERRLDAYVAARIDETGMRHLGILTDGVEWRLYHRVESILTQVQPSLTMDAANPDPEMVLVWLEAVLATGERLKPTPGEIDRKLGAHSPAYAVDTAELQALFSRYRDHPAVKLKRAVWAKLLTTASGANFADEDWLFVDHTLLVAMAEVIGHAVLGFEPAGPSVTAAEIMSGKHFSEARITGVIESDFFDWIVHVPGGSRFVKELARRITRFSWGEVQHDVMKVLYQSIIPEETRHQLGEYYTPDWLAEKIITECVDNPLEQRVLDASCGSGTFLFHAVRRYVAAAEAAGTPDREITRDVGKHVLGFDVHPVAVTLARVTYLLAIGMRRLQRDRPDLAVPVYLGDSLRWGQEPGLEEGLSVPTTLDYETFLSDPHFAGPSGLKLNFPDRVVSNVGLFDQLVAALAARATQRMPNTPPPSLNALFQLLEIDNAEDRAVLKQTFKNMCDLHDAGKDHIWGYYVRNIARPAWLTRPGNRVDVLVGNPPWLAFHFMTEAQKRSFKTMSEQRGLWAGAAVAPTQDLSALFIVRCIEQYLRVGGRFGYVMPLAVLTRRQYAGFRTGSYHVELEPVKIRFGRPWDLHRIKPSFFRQSVGVVFGRREGYRTGAASLTQVPELWSGRFDTAFASWHQARPCISRLAAEAPLPATTASPYRAKFFQGATVVPRFLFLVETSEPGPLGTGGGCIAVRSRRTAKENKRYKNLPSQRGMVEEQFIRPLHLGDTIMPFRCLQPLQAVIPWDGTRLIGGDDEDLDLYPGLAAWWRAAERVWVQHRRSPRLTLNQRLDYQRGLSRQFSAAAHRVVYSASGMYLAAAVVSDPAAVIEHKLYTGSVTSLGEARFLTAVLNSTTATLAVRHLQGRGEHNPRDFDKHIFQLPIPLYDAGNATHQQLVTLATRAEHVAAAVNLPEIDGVIAQIDAIAKLLFA